ncbi:hypothetical protein EMMF5_005489 [Cystobasidiomycetes sp. EMM_F5]
MSLAVVLCGVDAGECEKATAFLRPIYEVVQSYPSAVSLLQDMSSLPSLSLRAIYLCHSITASQQVQLSAAITSQDWSGQSWGAPRLVNALASSAPSSTNISLATLPDAPSRAIKTALDKAHLLMKPGWTPPVFKVSLVASTSRKWESPAEWEMGPKSPSGTAKTTSPSSAKSRSTPSPLAIYNARNPAYTHSAPSDVSMNRSATTNSDGSSGKSYKVTDKLLRASKDAVVGKEGARYIRTGRGLVAI